MARLLLPAVALLALAVGCKKSNPVPAAASSQATEVKSEPASTPPPADSAKKNEKREAVAQAMSAFLRTAESSSSDRLEAYKKFVDELESATGIADTTPWQNFRPASAKKVLDRLKELDGDEAKDKEGSAELPEKPEHSPPKYSGAVHISGIVKGCDRPGVALKVGEKYYYVKGADCPVIASVLVGYVEETGGTVRLDIGRDGRDAIEVTISDAEKAADDRRSFQKELREYEEEYKTKLAEYQKAVAENRDAIGGLEKRKAARESERKQLTVQLDKILVALISSKGESAGPPLNVDTAKTDVAGKSATPSAGAAAAPKKDRGACLRACIASCSNDANCERSCAVQKCN